MLENPMVTEFPIANDSAYRSAMDHALKTFVDNRGGTLTNIMIRGINDPKPQHLMENPSAFSLLFKDKYNFNEGNPKTRSILDIGRYRLEWDFRKKVIKGKKKLRQKRSDEFDENGNRIYKDKEGNIIPTFNIGADGKHNNVEPEDLGFRNLFGKYNNNEINHPVPQDSSDEEDEKERKEATLGINEHFANIESVVNNENDMGLLPAIDEQEDQEYFDQNKWRFFVKGVQKIWMLGLYLRIA